MLCSRLARGVLGWALIAAGWQAAVAGVGPGGGITSPNRGQAGVIDILPGDGRQTVWSLDVFTGTWTPFPSPAPLDPGAAISNLFNGCDYAFAGGSTNTFFRTGGGICGGTTQLADAPAPIGPGGSLVAAIGLVGSPVDTVFALRGDGTRDFWAYSISGDEWDVLPDLPEPALDGAALVQTCCFDVWALQGSGSRNMWLYRGSTQTWSAGAMTPAEVGPGASLAQLQRFGHIYVLRGGGSTDFWRFMFGTWTPLAPVPEPVGAGGGLVGVNYGTFHQRDILFAIVGGGSDSIYEYDVASDRWSLVGVVPPRAADPFPDLTPPAVTCSVSPPQLWPPNNTLRGVTASVSVTDGGSGPDGFELLAVTSDEGTPADAAGFDIGTADVSGSLRAARSGSGDGRTYTLTYEGRDGAGNTATCSVDVIVPHDQRRR